MANVRFESFVPGARSESWPRLWWRSASWSWGGLASRSWAESSSWFRSGSRSWILR